MIFQPQNFSSKYCPPYFEIIIISLNDNCKSKTITILKPNSYKKLFNDVELSKIELAIFQRNVLDFVWAKYLICQENPMLKFYGKGSLLARKIRLMVAMGYLGWQRTKVLLNNIRLIGVKSRTLSKVCYYSRWASVQDFQLLWQRLGRVGGKMCKFDKLAYWYTGSVFKSTESPSIARILEHEKNCITPNLHEWDCSNLLK